MFRNTPDAVSRSNVPEVSLRYAIASDVGRVRPNNEDAGYASARLLAVADGMGGHVGGEVASSIAITTLAGLDDDLPTAAISSELLAAVRRANDAIARRVSEEPGLTGMGTTLTAMLWSGARLALAHIGDCRAYRMRDGELRLLTEDHTLEQFLATELGRPVLHGNRLMRVLDGRVDRDPDLSVHDALPGDRYLLCSDGLTAPVPPETLLSALTDHADAAETVARLVRLANEAGGPDNVTAIVADVSEAPVDDRAGRPEPIIAGSARP